MFFNRALLFVLGLALCATTGAHASILALENDTSHEIINIQVCPTSGAPCGFLRLDLAPQGRANVDNPDFNANLRVDTGLEFWNFDNVPLKEIDRMVFCGEHPACLATGKESGLLLHITARVQPLTPQPGDRPVCELGRFRPMMPMKDVCAILEPDVPRDDNGAILAGLGFGGMVWAARLAPDGNGPITEQSTLEHLELRRPLTQQDLAKLLDTLEAQGYAPWQAEFPGLNIDFASSKGDVLEGQKRELARAIREFLAEPPRARQGEARILLAPSDSLGQLANADAPQTDVQLFTIILRQDVLLLDVAAYKGEGGK